VSDSGRRGNLGLGISNTAKTVSKQIRDKNLLEFNVTWQLVGGPGVKPAISFALACLHRANTENLMGSPIS
jgi:hypothetical protein